MTLPKNYLTTTGSAADPGLILNHALIDKQTNRTIKDQPPSHYLPPVMATRGVKKFNTIPESQLLPEAPLLADDYEAFLTARLASEIAEVESVTGQTITTLPTRLRNVFMPP
jgi:hypothetical protein